MCVQQSLTLLCLLCGQWLQHVTMILRSLSRMALTNLQGNWLSRQGYLVPHTCHKFSQPWCAFGVMATHPSTLWRAFGGTQGQLSHLSSSGGPSLSATVKTRKGTIYIVQWLYHSLQQLYRDIGTPLGVTASISLGLVHSNSKYVVCTYVHVSQELTIM